MMNVPKLLFLIAMIGFSMACKRTPAEDVALERMRCEMRTNPKGIDVLQPRLSWNMLSNVRGQKQTAYRILVASTAESLDRDTGDIWDSGKVLSDRSDNIEFGGINLESDQKYFWKVRIWEKEGRPSVWSSDAHWTTGLINDTDWNAKWIGFEKALEGDDPDAEHRVLSARMLRSEFSIEKEISKASAFVCGLGLFELYLNGEKIGDQVLAPALSEYDKRLYYMTFDVTDKVSTGTNAVGTMLGNGRFFAPRSDSPARTKDYGFPKVILQINLSYTDGTSETIISDRHWKITSKGPIRKNNEYDGEYYDARNEMKGWSQPGFDDGDWRSAELVEKPLGNLVAQANEPIRITDIVKTIKISEPKKGVYVFDMGQNMVGWAQLKVQGKRGTKVKMRFSETLQDNGMLYLENIRGAEVTDTYILRGGEPETWEPRFTYHGFRFVEVTGYPGEPNLNTLEGKVVHDDMEITGTFETSNPLINQIYKNAFWGIRGNYRSIPTDCPQRDERHGWLGDRSTGSKGETFVFGNGNLYRKWMIDVDDSQLESGSVPDVAPSLWPIYTDNATWPGSFILIPDMLYRQFGDQRIIEQLYPGMKKWMDYMSTFIEDGIMPKDTYGDWCVPPTDKYAIHSSDIGRLTTGELIGSAYFYHELKLMEGFAVLLNKAEDAQIFGEMAEDMKAAFNDKFLDKKLVQYSNNSQTSSVLPLAFGMVPEAYEKQIFDNLVLKIMGEGQGHIGTGLIGSQWIMRVLSDYGRPDIAYTIAAQNSYPSWGYMVENDATTIWELWNGNTGDPSMNSHNHVMLLGDLIIWYYENLAGIKAGSEALAFKHIIMKPEVVGGLDFVNASYNSVYGKISSKWKIVDGKFNWDITIPANTTATVYVPASKKDDVLEGGKLLDEVEGVEFLKQDGSRVLFEVQSGSYTFTSETFEKLEAKRYVSSPVISPGARTLNIGEELVMKINCSNAKAEIRYTLDSSTPDESSAKYEKPIIITQSTFVRAKAFEDGAYPSVEKTAYFDFADPKRNGIKWSLYRGDFLKVPDFDQLKPVAQGVTLKPEFQGLDIPDKAFALQLNGFIDVEIEGEYTFYLSSNDGSQLYIDDKLLVNNDGEHGATEKSKSIHLNSGKHKIKVGYFQSGGGKFLLVSYEGPNIARRVLPASILYAE